MLCDWISTENITDFSRYNNPYCVINIWIKLRHVSPYIIRPQTERTVAHVMQNFVFCFVLFSVSEMMVLLLICLLCLVGCIFVPVCSHNTFFGWMYSRCFFYYYLVLLLLCFHLLLTLYFCLGAVWCCHVVPRSCCLFKLVFLDVIYYLSGVGCTVL